MTARFFFEVTLLPHADVTPVQAFSRAVEVMHEMAAGDFAILFPDAKNGGTDADMRRIQPSLGRKVQVFAQELATLQTISERLSAFGDVFFLGRIKEVRPGTVWRASRRRRELYRTQATIEREIRRATRRAAARGESLSAEQIDARRKGLRKPASWGQDLPCLFLRSKSTKRVFPVHIETIEASEPGAWKMDGFGFSVAGPVVPAI